MLLGAGKTTVVGPLLCLLLADGKNLVSQAVPGPLLSASTSVLRFCYGPVLSRPVTTLQFERGLVLSRPVLNRLLEKLDYVIKKRGVVVCTPETIKSLMLKYIETLHEISQAINSNKEMAAMEEDLFVASCLGKVLHKWRSGVLILDEVDLILNPLTSELNFPVGVKRQLLPSPERWQIPLHFFDAFFYHSSGHLTVAALLDNHEAQSLLSEFSKALLQGVEMHCVQMVPHLVLLSTRYYQSTLLPLLARWMVLWLRAKGVSGSSVLAYLQCSSQQFLPHSEQYSPVHMQLLNLSHDWLHSFAPHALAKINRVSYGLLLPTDERANSFQPDVGEAVALRRRLVAIPFVAKDVPSRTSEFAHPDVLIGLTILAYKFQGLRLSDIIKIAGLLKSQFQQEPGPEETRKANVLFESWVLASERLRIRSCFSNQNLAMPLSIEDEEKLLRIERSKRQIVPLSMLQLVDGAQLELLHEHFRLLPPVIYFALQNLVFPEALFYYAQNLSASGQELGGDILFGLRLGFSGTPSNLLPLELGECVYEACTDAKVLAELTSSLTVSYSIASSWTVKGFLTQLARCQGHERTHALIDSGALIQGMNNFDVARFLLDQGLTEFDGVVYLDECDNQRILLRTSPEPCLLAQCGVAPERRFTFYDHIHTTGTNVSQMETACATMTIGKDMTFRDLSQGAFRMRGLGRGQRVHLTIIPEVASLIAEELGGLATGRMLVDIAAWLTINSLRSAQLQAAQLHLHNLHNVWRKHALTSLLECIHYEDEKKRSFPPGIDWQMCMEVFRSPVSFAIAETVPSPTVFCDVIDDLVLAHQAFIVHESQYTAITLIRRNALDLRPSQISDSKAEETEDMSRILGFDKEMINQQEAERSQQRMVLNSTQYNYNRTTEVLPFSFSCFNFFLMRRIYFVSFF